MRLYVDAPLDGSTLGLDADQAHYLGRVLRCREGQEIVVFNARGRERRATIESLAKRRARVRLGETLEPLAESPLRIVLLQALVKSDAMDLIVQKATELGVDTIVATRTEFSVVRLDGERESRRLEHWQRIARSACEQSGRHRPPALVLQPKLSDALAALPPDCTRIAFDTNASIPLDAASIGAGVCLAIGPEGGFSENDRAMLAAEGFEFRSFGPRILRADTAAIAACTAVQLLGGDLG